LALIVFDCDGTLVDSQHAIVATMTAAFAEMGQPAPRAGEIRDLIGLSLEETAARLWPAAEANQSAQLIDIYRRLFFEQRRHAAAPDPLYPHAETVLRQLSAQGYQLGVATGKSRRGLDAVLHSHNLKDLFLTLQTADVHPGKPDPAMLYQAMADVGATVENTLMLGDTSFDMAMAVNAGVRPVGVAWGYHDEEALVAAGAQVVLNDFPELMAWIAENWPELKPEPKTGPKPEPMSEPEA
jgi:phosphoglycolate phosphatase